MSGRPPPPLPPSSATAARTRSTAETLRRQVIGDTRRNCHFAAGIGNKQDRTAAHPRLVLVDQRRQIAALHARKHLCMESNPTYLARGNGFTLPRAACHGQIAAQLRHLVGQGAALLHQRFHPLGHILGRVLRSPATCASRAL